MRTLEFLVNLKLIQRNMLNFLNLLIEVHPILFMENEEQSILRHPLTYHLKVHQIHLSTDPLFELKVIQNILSSW